MVSIVAKALQLQHEHAGERGDPNMWREKRDRERERERRQGKGEREREKGQGWMGERRERRKMVRRVKREEKSHRKGTLE